MNLPRQIFDEFALGKSVFCSVTTAILQSYFDTLRRYAVTFCGANVLKVMDQKTLVKRKGGYRVRLTVYI